MKPDRTAISMPDASLDNEIEAILSVEPSPEFVARVRKHITSTPVPGWTIGWTSLAAGSVVVAVFVAVVISRPYDVIQQEALGPATARSIRVDAPSDDVPASPNRSTLKPPEPRKPGVSKAAFQEPEMLINPEDAAAMRRFLSNPQRERVELSLLTIEPQPLPEFTFTPLPIFDSMAVLQGDYK